MNANFAPVPNRFANLDMPYIQMLWSWYLNDETIMKIIEQGFCDLDSLILYTSEELSEALSNVSKLKNNPLFARNNVIVIDIPQSVKVNLQIVQYGAMFMYRTGQPISAQVCDNVFLMGWKQRMMEIKGIREKYKSTPPTKPDKLKSMAKFDIFWENFQAYLGMIYGAADCPLTYVICEVCTPDPNDFALDFNDIDTTAIDMTLHQGTHWNVDNARVWEELQSLTRDGPAWTYIMGIKKKDGRKACETLQLQGEGKNVKQVKISSAYHTIDTLRWEGSKRGYSYEDYVNKHTKCHQALLKQGVVLDEFYKINKFLAGISDPALSQPMETARSQDQYMENFERLQQYLGSRVDLNAASGRGGKRNISAISFDEDSKPPAKANFKKNKKGKGKQQSQADNAEPTKKDLDPNNKGYRSPKIWRKMMETHRSVCDKIIKDRGNKKGNRSVSEISTEDYHPGQNLTRRKQMQTPN